MKNLKKVLTIILSIAVTFGGATHTDESKDPKGDLIDIIQSRMNNEDVSFLDPSTSELLCVDLLRQLKIMFTQGVSTVYSNGDEEQHNLLIAEKIIRRCRPEMILTHSLRYYTSQIFGDEGECFKKTIKTIMDLTQMKKRFTSDIEISNCFKKARDACERHFELKKKVKIEKKFSACKEILVQLRTVFAAGGFIEYGKKNSHTFSKEQIGELNLTLARGIHKECKFGLNDDNDKLLKLVNLLYKKDGACLKNMETAVVQLSMLEEKEIKGTGEMVFKLARDVCESHFNDKLKEEHLL